MTRFKVCGLTRAPDAVAAIDAGADFIGLIFAPSKRQLLPDQARDLLQTVRALRSSVGQRPQVVGVFVNAPAEEINEIAESCGLDTVQLHGDETLEDCADIERPIFKVVRIEAGANSEDLLPSLKAELEAITNAGYTPMLDTVSKGQYYGGTGRPFDWELAAELARKHHVVLSGGLSPDNVATAIQRVGPWAVDVSSGVEIDGLKDEKKIRGFARAVAEADKTSSPARPS